VGVPPYSPYGDACYILNHPSDVVAQLTRMRRPVGCFPVRWSPSCLSPSWYVAQMTVRLLRPSRLERQRRLTENFADTGVVHVRTCLEDGAPFLARPHHERVHRTLDMLLLLLLLLHETLLGRAGAASRSLRRWRRTGTVVGQVFGSQRRVETRVVQPSSRVGRVVCKQNNSYCCPHTPRRRRCQFPHGPRVRTRPLLRHGRIQTLVDTTKCFWQGEEISNRCFCHVF